MTNEVFVLEISIPEKKCPNIRNRDKLIQDGRARVFLANNTTQNDAMNGFTRYGVSGGRTACIFTQESFLKYEAEITGYLNERFGQDWNSKLTLLNVKSK